MIERPAPAGAGVAPASEAASEAVEAAPVPQAGAPKRAGLALPPEPPHVLAGREPEPALAPEPAVPGAPPREFPDRTKPPFGPPRPRPTSTRGATRPPARTEHEKYRLVFACSREATNTPTK